VSIEQRVAELDRRIADLEVSAWSGNKTAWSWLAVACTERAELTGEPCGHHCAYEEDTP
jgi:hypothetical protein